MSRLSPPPRTRAARRKPLIVIAVLLGIGALGSFAYSRRMRVCCTLSPSSVTPAESVPFDSARARAADDFGAQLLALVAKEHAGENIFLSPFSAQLALSMIYNGAAGETRRAMGQALGVGATGLEDFNRYNAALIRRLSGNHNVTLDIANSLWGKSGVPFTPAFLERARTDYGAEVASLDLSSPDAMKRINRWVSARTHKRIRTILDHPSPGVLVLLNAVYFKGTWSTPFEKSATRDRPFHLASGAIVQRPTMMSSGGHGYARGQNFQAVRLAYEGNEQSMYVLLPDWGVPVSALYDQLGSAAVGEWRDMSSAEVNLELPRFKLEYGVDLMPPLAGLGMSVALDFRRADFSGMVPAEYLAGQRLFISGATQKTFVEVNEEGTEAAAATEAEMSVTSVSPEFQPKNFIVDRPFLIVIRDDPTGALLFVGQIMDPK